MTAGAVPLAFVASRRAVHPLAVALLAQQDVTNVADGARRSLSSIEVIRCGFFRLAGTAYRMAFRGFRRTEQAPHRHSVRQPPASTGSSTSRTGCRGAIGDDGSILATFPTNAAAWRYVDRQSSEPILCGEAVSAWIMSRIGTAGQAGARTLEATEEPTMTDTVPHTIVNAVTGAHHVIQLRRRKA